MEYYHCDDSGMWAVSSAGCDDSQGQYEQVYPGVRPEYVLQDYQQFLQQRQQQQQQQQQQQYQPTAPAPQLPNQASAPVFGQTQLPYLVDQPNGANGPRPEDDYAFFRQFEMIDRARAALIKFGKFPGEPRRILFRNTSPSDGSGSRASNRTNPSSSRPGSMASFDQTSSNGSSTYGQRNNHHSHGYGHGHGSHNHTGPDQMHQNKRRIAAQRERELRNMHTEHQHQHQHPRSFLTDGWNEEGAFMSAGPVSEAAVRNLIARQQNAIYGQGPFRDHHADCVDDNGGATRSGPAGPLAGRSSVGFDHHQLDGSTMPTSGGSAGGAAGAVNLTPATTTNSTPSTCRMSTAATAGSSSSAASSQKTLTSTSPVMATSLDGPSGGQASPAGTVSPPGSQQNPAPVAPIGTRPAGTPVRSSTPAGGAGSAKKPATPVPAASGAGWSNPIWGQPTGNGGEGSGPQAWG